MANLLVSDLEAVSLRVPLSWGLKEIPKDTRIVDRSVVQLLTLLFGQRVVALVGFGAFSSADQFCADALEHDCDVTPHHPQERGNGHEGLTAAELAFRIGVDFRILQPILNDERDRGRVLLDPETGGYQLVVDALPPGLFEALRGFKLV